MKQVLIVEDEITAADKLIDMLSDTFPAITTIVSQSVQETVEIIRNTNYQFDCGFFDIQLADDVSFEILKQVKIEFPIIFTTAYDQYILKALEENAIDYLLKPIRMDRLSIAIKKVKTLEHHFIQSNLETLISGTNELPRTTKNRYLVKKGVDFVSVKSEQIAYFFTEHKVSFLVDHQGQRYIIDKSITDLSGELDPDQFFRANRKYVVSIEAIEKFRSDSGKLVLTLCPPTNDEVVVSKETAPKFRDWIDK